MSGARIVEGIQDAIAGNLASVTINGQTWVRRETFTELYEALAAAVRLYDEHEVPEPLRKAWRNVDVQWTTRARAALSKARGETP